MKRNESERERGRDEEEEMASRKRDASYGQGERHCSMSAHTMRHRDGQSAGHLRVHRAELQVALNEEERNPASDQAETLCTALW